MAEPPILNSTRPQRPRWSLRTILWRAGLLLGLALFANQLRIAWLALRQHEGLGGISLGPLFPAFVAALALSAFQMLAWRSIMRYLRVDLSLRETTEGFMISFLPRYIPGTVWGYLSRSQWLQQDYGVGYPLSLTGSVLEAAAILVTAIACVGVTSGPLLGDPWRGVVPGGAIVLVVLASLLAPRSVAWAGRRFRRLAFPPEPSLRAWAAALTLTVPLWLSYAVSVYAVARAVAPAYNIDLRVSALAASASWAVGFLVLFVPSGIGVREAIMSSVLAQAAGLPVAMGGLVAVVSRFLLVLAELTWVLAGFALRAARKGRREAPV